jgi:hypothetical protein
MTASTLNKTAPMHTNKRPMATTLNPNLLLAIPLAPLAGAAMLVCSVPSSSARSRVARRRIVAHSARFSALPSPSSCR